MHSYPEAAQYREETEETTQGLMDERQRLVDAVHEVDMASPDAERIIEHLEDLIDWCDRELELAGVVL